MDRIDSGSGADHSTLVACSVAAILLAFLLGGAAADEGLAQTPQTTSAATGLRIEGSLHAEGFSDAMLGDLEVTLRPYPSSFQRRIEELEPGLAPEPTSRSIVEGGRFVVTAAEPGIWRLTIEDPAHRLAPVAVDLVPLLHDVVLPAIELERGVLVEARVTGPGGAPVEGALVLFDSVNGRGTDLLEEQRSSAVRAPFRPRTTRQVRRTDADGVASARLPAGPRWVRAAHPAYLMDESNATGERVTLQLHTGVDQGVVIEEPGGRPAAGAVVSMGRFSVPIARADEEGRIRVMAHAESAVSYRLESAAPAFAELSLAPRQKASPAAQRIRLENPRAVHGTVLDASSGLPVADALVFSTWRPGDVVRSDRRGQFGLPLAERQWSAIQIAHPHYLPKSESLPSTLELLGDLEVSVEPSLRLTGRIVDEQGTPVPGATVAVEGGTVRRGRPSSRTATASAPDGGFVLHGVTAEGGRLLVEHPAFVPHDETHQALAKLAAASPFEVVLQRGIVLTGGVVDEQLRPVAGARVLLYERQRDAQPDPGYAMRLARSTGARHSIRLTGETDAAGRFRIPHAQAGHFDLIVLHDRYAEASVPGVQVSEEHAVAGEHGAPAELELGEVTLSRALSVVGRVLGADGAPLEGAELSRVSEPDNALLRSRREPDARSDADGRFEIAGIPPKTPVHLAVRASRHGPQVVRDIEPGARDVEIELQPGADLRVLVEERLESGGSEPADPTSVRLQPTRYDGVPVAASAVTENGEALLEGLSPGRYRLQVHATGRLAHSEELDLAALAPGDEPPTVTVVLERGRRILVTVVDPAGLPLEEAQIDAQLVMDDPVQLAEAQRSGQHSLAAIPHFGRFELVAPTDRDIHVVALHPGHRTETRTVPAGDEDLALRIEMRPGLTVTGVVVTPDGDPVAEARVSARPPEPGNFGGGRLGDGATTQADGSFRLGGLAEGDHVLSAHHHDWAPSEPVRIAVSEHRPSAGVTLQMRPGLAIEGVVVGLDVDALARLRITAHPMSGTYPYFGRGASPDYEGRFELGQLWPGTWLVKGEEQVSGRTRQQSVTLTEGGLDQPVELRFGDGFTLAVRVRERGEPAAGAFVYAIDEAAGMRSQGAGNVRTDANGEARLADLPPGDYQVYVSLPSGAVSQQQVALDGDREIEIDLRGIELTGQVVEAGTGAPVAEASVVVYRGSGTSSGLSDQFAGRALTGADGSFALTLPDATNRDDSRFSYQAQAEGYVADQGVLDPAVANRIVLERATALRLRLTPPPPHGSHVQLRASDGRRWVQGVSRVNPSEDGSVVFQHLGVGAWRAVVTTERGFARFEAVVPTPEGAIPTLTLEPFAVLRIVTGSRAQGTAAIVSEPGLASTTAVLGAAVLDESIAPGSPSRAEDGAFVIPGLPDGDLVLRIRAADGSEEEHPVRLVAGATTEIVLP
ncbi:MAG: carboxypeptidase regulatory-like domain-containing protein [Acidobacteria bacterium]|nr:MAG: carboxypeptidase regulatory-like domain-containing protein [Acidobacteriota bacterium]